MFNRLLHEQRSLFGEILDWMLAPLLLLWPLSLGLTWLVAQAIANRPYDQELADVVLALARQSSVELVEGAHPAVARRRDLESTAAAFSRSDDEALRRTVRFLILHHLRANQYDRGWTDSAVRRFAREMGPHLHDLFCLSRADITTKRPEKKRRGLSQLDDLQGRIADLAVADAKLPPLPSGVGNAIMTAFGLRPSKQIGEIKFALERAIERGAIEERLPSAAYVLFAYDHADDFGLRKGDANVAAIDEARHEVAQGGYDARYSADAAVDDAVEASCGA